MSRRWLTRTAVALAVPVLAVPALTTPAVAASAPKVPTVAKVAKIYPYLAGGTATEATSKVKSAGKNCKAGKPVKGASARSASYMPADFTAGGSAASPYVYTSALKFRNAKDAAAYLKGSSKNTKKCPGIDLGTGGDVKVKVKKLKFKLGDESWGYTVTTTFSGTTSVSQSLLARKGKIIITVGASAMDGGTPSAKQATKLAKLTLKTAS